MSEQQPVFSIEKIYVKDLSIEVPNAPQCFLERESAQIAVQMGSSANARRRGHLRGDPDGHGHRQDRRKDPVPGRSRPGRHLRQIQNVPQEDIEPIVAVACPNILFPYAREAVSDAVIRAGFPPVLLAPVNFEAIYRQRLESEQRPARGSGSVRRCGVWRRSPSALLAAAAANALDYRSVVEPALLYDAPSQQAKPLYRHCPRYAGRIGGRRSTPGSRCAMPRANWPGSKSACSPSGAT